MLTDEILAWILRSTGVSMEVVFFAGYLLALALVWAALLLIGRSTYGSRWLIIALAAAFTLRHRIPRTSANSFEPYFHPRTVAFGLGALAIAAVLHRRRWMAVALVGIAAIVHITTALWFAVLVGVALAVVEPTLRRFVLVGGAAAAAFLVWAVMAGPLRQSMTTMDAVWLEAVSGKDSLFATQWPAWAWAANLGMLAILWLAHRRRQAQGLARREDAALVWGTTALVAIFLATLPLVIARLTLPVQLQIPRVFWLVGFVATVYLLGTIRHERIAATVALVLVAFSVTRGVYVLAVEHPDRPLFGVWRAQTPWEQSMDWLAKQPKETNVLAHPGHAWKYGASVRVSAGRDVFVEDVKDSAVAIYSREVAARYVERMNALSDFDGLSPDRARELAGRYDLDYLVTEMDVALPIAYRNEQFRIYSLSAGTP
jgi:hypothetical protein